MKHQSVGTGALFTLAGVLLAACGGGNSGSGSAPASGVSSGAAAPTPAPLPPPVATAEGLYIGTTSNFRTVIGVILDNGTYWVLYSSMNNPAVIAGAVQGAGVSTAGSFSSSNAKDFDVEAQSINSANVSASYVAKQAFNGMVTYALAIPAIAFTTTYSSVYEISPTIATIAGTYIGTAAVLGGTETATLTIANSGALVGRGASNCQFTGTVSPHAVGNVYDVSVTFGGGVCSNGTNTVTGIGYFDATPKRLYGVALNSARSNGFIFVGTKP